MTSTQTVQVVVPGGSTMSVTVQPVLRGPAGVKGDIGPTPDVSRLIPYNPVLEGLPFFVYGASYEGADINNTSSATRYPFRFARRFGLVQTNRAISGDESSDMFFNLSELNSTRRLVPGTKGLIQVSGVLNDALRSGTAQYRDTTFKNNLKACIYRAFCSTLVEATDASITYSGLQTGQTIANGWLTTNTAIGGQFAKTMNYKQTALAGATGTSA
jgi:hypothetical protein